MGQSVEVVVSELHMAAARLEDAAQRLTNGLSSVEDETTQLLGSGWKSDAASAYAPAWDKWHDGAGQVVQGLQRMAELLTIAGKEYAKTDQSGADALGATVQGSSGSTGGGGVTAAGEQGVAGLDRSGAIGAGQAARSTEGGQQLSSSVSQSSQAAVQALGQAAQGAAGLAQQAAQLATQLAQQAGQDPSQEGHSEDDEVPADEREEASARSGDPSEGHAPVESVPTPPDDASRAVQRPGE